MTLQEAKQLSKEKGVWFNRPSWHFSIIWSEELDYFTTHYNCEYISFSPEDELAEDYTILS